LNRDKLAKMLAPQNTLWPLSFGALTLIFIVGGAKRRTSCSSRSWNPGYIVVPPLMMMLL
jgi:hypothetical protein